MRLCSGFRLATAGHTLFLRLRSTVFFLLILVSLLKFEIFFVDSKLVKLLNSSFKFLHVS